VTIGKRNVLELAVKADRPLSTQVDSKDGPVGAFKLDWSEVRSSSRNNPASGRPLP